MTTFIFLKKLIAILLLHAFLLQLCNKVGILTWFKINQKEITELFCINKSKPELACDGKCYLKYKLQKATDSETSNSSVPNPIMKQVQEEFLVSQILIYGNILNTQKVYFHTHKNLYFHQVSFSNFHPPRV